MVLLAEVTTVLWHWNRTLLCSSTSASVLAMVSICMTFGADFGKYTRLL